MAKGLRSAGRTTKNRVGTTGAAEKLCKGSGHLHAGALPAFSGDYFPGNCGGGKGNGVLLNELDAGRCFGAAALFVTQERYVTTVRAKTACQLLFLSMEAMQEMMMQYPQIALNYIRFLSGRIQFLNRRIDSFIAPSAEESLLSYLRQQPEGISRDLPISRLAELLNLGRTSIYRAAEHLEQQGMIRREGRCIQLTESISREIAEPVSREITAGISQETTAPEIKKG